MYSIGKVVNYIIRAIICVTAFIFANTVYVKADIIEKAEIQLSMDCPIEITNKEGETLIIGDKRELSGTMNILKQEYTATMPADVVLTVRKSDIYYIKKVTKGYSYVAICYANSDRSVLVTLNDEASVVIDMIKKRVEISGISQKFSCEICMNANDIWYTLDGFLSEKTVLEDKDDSLLTSGICGKTDVSICDMEKEIYMENKDYYFLDGDNSLYIKNGTPYVENAIKLNNKSSKKLEGLYVRPINNDKEMLLTWMKVKKANSYIVYKYDNEKNKYKKVVTLNGNDNNCYSEPIINNEIYRYKVVAKKKKNGKGKRVCNVSYEVWAVPEQNEKSNATAVTLKNYKKIVLKKDSAKSFKLKRKGAKAIYSSKMILSKKIRWYCSNKRVLKINNKKGKMKALKKGKCYIWAKAHNGINSKKIKVIIK